MHHRYSSDNKILLKISDYFSPGEPDSIGAGTCRGCRKPLQGVEADKPLMRPRSLKVKLWREKASMTNGFSVGDKIVVKNLKVMEFRGSIFLNSMSDTSIMNDTEFTNIQSSPKKCIIAFLQEYPQHNAQIQASIQMTDSSTQTDHIIIPQELLGSNASSQLTTVEEDEMSDSDDPEWVPSDEEEEIEGINITCDCGYTKSWKSQPISNTMPVGNLVLAGAILFSGNNPNQGILSDDEMAACENDSISDSNQVSQSESELWNAIDQQIVISSDSGDNSEIPKSKQLTSWVNKNNISHNSTDKLLKILKMIGLKQLPPTTTSLLKTKRHVDK
ncbi:unnamed protein product [Mytilus edulis]|uniref:Uncharacterized protein n=1 Tax=Mytilus edulis TaxID=6550 RepID=A0A8S3TIT9_MYTED|nr:unnamed protein product [Mytilus edulis]